MIDTTGKCSACGQTVGIDTIHTCSPQVTAPTPERRVGEARVAELAALEIVDEALGLSAEVQCQRILYNEKVRVARDLLDERAAVARLTAERDAVESAVRKLCPLDNNEGYEDEDGDAVVYRCMNEDGDAFIETESLAEAVEGMVASYDRVCEAFEAAQEEKHRLTAEVERLRGALVKVRAHTAHTKASPDELHIGLLASIERIADAALSLPTPAPEAPR